MRGREKEGGERGGEGNRVRDRQTEREGGREKEGGIVWGKQETAQDCGPASERDKERHRQRGFYVLSVTALSIPWLQHHTPPLWRGVLCSSLSSVGCSVMGLHKLSAAS